MYFITTQNDGKTYYYRKSGIRWVTNQSKADQFQPFDAGHAIQVILDMHPDYQVTIVPA